MLQKVGEANRKRGKVMAKENIFFVEGNKTKKDAGILSERGTLPVGENKNNVERRKDFRGRKVLVQSGILTKNKCWNTSQHMFTVWLMFSVGMSSYSPHVVYNMKLTLQTFHNMETRCKILCLS